MVIHYKCPNCGSDMEFNARTGKLTCHSCSREDNIEAFPQEFIRTTFSEDDTKEYNCKNCGAVLITEKETSATTCSFCGAGVVLLDRLSGEFSPSKVIPFTITKDEAIQAFKTWCKNGLLTPKDFMTADRIKSITGMYVPFWLYDLNGRAQVTAIGTKVRTYRKGDYRYTETSHYELYRDITLDYLKIPVDASEKMNDELMDRLEPYNYGDMKDFNPPYLAGYIAEKYNYNDTALLSRAKSKITGYIDNYISSTVAGYSSVRFQDKNININKNKSYYTLLPVWVLFYDYNKTEYVFAMNGQTGKVVGKPPISPGKVLSWFGKISGTTFVVLKIISLVMGGGLW